MTYESDEDEQPLVFKRSNITSKQIHSNPDVKRSSSSQNHDGKSGGRPSDVRSPNGQNSSNQKGNTDSTYKATKVKSSLASPKALSSSAKALQVKSPVSSSKASTSAPNKSKHSSQQNATSVVKEEKRLSKPSVDPNDDSEDEKPLSSRLLTGLSKGNSNHATKRPDTSVLSSSPPPKPRVKDEEDSDDERPLSLKIVFKSNPDEKPLSSKILSKSNAASTSKSYDSDDNKPLSSKLQQNGSALRDNQIKKSNAGLKKRPSSDVKSSSQLSVKKPKLSDASPPTNSKPVSVKAVAKLDDDENDNVPISHRMKKPSTSGSKSSSVKQKVTKVVSSLKKTNKNSKKVMKKSKYLKSSKVPPGSGEGQKWTSLEHNGVIFPPPYKPHGIKMLYKKKPVDLSPEQEEVATMFAVMLETDYMTKPKFKENFMSDWRKILGKNHVIQNLDDCDFTPINKWHLEEKLKKQQMTSEVS